MSAIVELSTLLLWKAAGQEGWGGECWVPWSSCITSLEKFTPFRETSLEVL
jgi:hypothetical protein